MTNQSKSPLIAGVLSALVLTLTPVSSLANDFSQTNLVSDVPGLADVTDPNLIDPWGVSFSATSPFWVSDNVSNLSTLYSGTPAINATVVSVPGAPTGQVNNGTTGFLVNGTPAHFIFDTQSGTIAAWNSGTTAATEFSNPAASYTGLAIGASGGNTYLYAANSAGTIDVFNSSFAPVALAGNFTDPNLPAGYVPYNVQLIGTQLYVTYVVYDSMGNETPSGIVDIFDTSGNFINRFSSSSNLDAPWGITLAPTTFGAFGGDILIGNFLNGEINAFDPITGAYLGTLDGPNGLPLVNDGLWALDFRTGGTGDNTNALYFTAGIDDEQEGLFGAITPVPEPTSLMLVGMGLSAVAVIRRRFHRA